MLVLTLLLGLSWSTDDIAASLQDLIICIEMLGCAVAHHYVFPIPSAIEYDQEQHDKYEAGYQNNQPLLDKVSSLAAWCSVLCSVLRIFWCSGVSHDDSPVSLLTSDSVRCSMPLT